jgi:hypothetical protein
LLDNYGQVVIIDDEKLFQRKEIFIQT